MKWNGIMANRHFGQIGDIWKHLPLADVLAIEQPAFYWESHAGSAQYELTHSEARDYGVYHFLKHAYQNDILADSAYFWLTSTMAQADKPMYPGSPGIAMATLSPKDTSFLFYDTDQASLDSIAHTAKELDGPTHRVKAVCADSLSHMRDQFRNMSFTQANETFLFIDPYNLLETDAQGMNALDLFCTAALKGIKTMLWFGAQNQDEYNKLLLELHQAFFMHHLDMEEHHVWLGRIRLSDTDNVDQGFNPGVWGCSILCANLSHESLATCAHLGRALEQTYCDARFPDTTSGAVRFSQTMFQTHDKAEKAIPIINTNVFVKDSIRLKSTQNATESLT